MEPEYSLSVLYPEPYKSNHCKLYSGRKVKITTHFYLVQRLKMQPFMVYLVFIQEQHYPYNLSNHFTGLGQMIYRR
jgi:hypothetical protein